MRSKLQKLSSAGLRRNSDSQVSPPDSCYSPSSTTAAESIRNNAVSFHCIEDFGVILHYRETSNHEQEHAI